MMTDAERRALRALVVFLLVGQAMVMARHHWPRLLPDVLTATTVAAAAAPETAAPDTTMPETATPDSAMPGGAARVFAPHLLSLDSRRSAGRAPAGLPHRVDINAADAAAWCALPGIGAKKAAAILAERHQGGPFRSVQDLTRVRGIGPATVARLTPWLRCDPPHRLASTRERSMSTATRPIHSSE